MGQNFVNPGNNDVFFLGCVTSGKVTLMPLSGGRVTYSQTTLSIPQPVISSLDQPSSDGVSLSNNKISDGGDDMEKRLAVLETEVSHIKSDISYIRDDVKKLQTDVEKVSRDTAVVLQKLVDIDSNLSKKPSTSDMSSAIASAANKQIVWTIGIAIAILGLAKYIF